MAIQTPDPTHGVATSKPSAERTTQKFLDGLNGSGGPPMESLTPAAARAVLTKAQSSADVSLRPADVRLHTITVDGQPLELTIVRPAGVAHILPVFMFFHGGGWVLGDFPTHERFIRDLVAESGAAAVYVAYTPSPEAVYPTAINQAYAATKWIAEHGQEINVDGSRLAVVGNSVGGNMATVVALRAALERGPQIRFQVLFWPVTDARFETASYSEFESDHFLTRPMMKWFWDNYTKDAARRNEVYASPLRASLEQLKDLPPALVQTAELDVLRDEGESYARKLNQAGVEVIAVRVNGMIHDFGLLNALSGVPAVQAALRQAAMELKRRLA